MHLQPNGNLTESGPGPTDRTQTSSGKWSVAGKILTLKKPGQADRAYEIASASPDKLVLQEKQT
jgi:hypothetical protein